MAGDCDDFDAERYPGAREACNGLDDDCDGALDPREVDEDSDGSPACLDCDDGDPESFPGATELCNGTDDDCDGEIDEDNPNAPAWYPDQDGDGFGDPDARLNTCAPPLGYVEDGSDCDDADARRWPGNREHCDDIDHDCDGTAWPRLQAEDAEALEAAIDMAAPGETICVAEGDYAIAGRLGRAVHLEGAGPERTVIRGRNRDTALWWRMPGETTVARGSVRRLTLIDDSVRGVLVATGGVGVDLVDVTLSTEGVQGLRVQVEGVATWSRVRVTGPEHATRVTIAGPQVRVEGLRIADLIAWWSASNGIRLDEVTGAELIGVRIVSTSAPDWMAGALLEARVLDDVEVRDLTLELPPLRGISTDGHRGLVLSAVEARDVRFSGVRGQAGTSRGPLLRVNQLDGLEIHDVRLTGTALLGLIGPSAQDRSDVRWRDLELHDLDLDVDHLGGLITPGDRQWRPALVEAATVEEARVVARQVWGGLIDATTNRAVRIEDLDARAVTIDATERITGGLLASASGPPALHGSVLAGLHLKAPEANLLWSTFPATMSFATWRDVQVHGATTSLAGPGTCTLHHLDLSASELTAEGCSVTWSNVHDTPAFDTTGLSTHPPEHLDTTSPDPLAWDLRLSSSSPLRDAGDPSVRDADGTRADISGYGGP